jgi:hypothetical protein
VAFFIFWVYATEEELGAGGSKLETEHGSTQYVLGYEGLKYWRCAIGRYGFKTQAHQAIGREVGAA